ncbi:uncharacterized protein Z520_04982 [Fonsecaea multimorphosa CBS 102226]|uniref:glutathione transferase n=1 Tax=Fonsecaea multimorphosa CBS 102226 TaxID=1442371 RepID=A0A0D2IR17_9EURO|nr:uncharacterized protein Z520_04982 [Fonsecaea multimorphosa CBS 102226]KIX99406.1 hypothetical protein Z520_04982 [Fonsecaea multimorphosa CBS 102226]
MSKPVILYSYRRGTNPWKVAMALEELMVPYVTKFLDKPEMKQEPFEKINPNGRAPAIVDPNTGITIWESVAIIEYLVETYDRDHIFTYTTSPEKWELKQWLYYQMSGQGPYFGQASWFILYHEEKLQSAIDRYLREIRRVVGVLDRYLQDREYLVGDKFTIADLSFITWNMLVPWLFSRGASKQTLDIEKEFPAYNAWQQRMMARPAVIKVVNDRKAAMAEAGMVPN